MIDPVAETIKAYDEKAQEFQERYLRDSNDTGMLPWLQSFTKLLPAQAKLLDIGSGAGFDAKYFSDHGFDVTSIDLATNLLKIAQKNAPKVNFQRMDLRAMTFEPATFDGVWACASLLHMPKSNMPNVLSDISKLLKPNGVFYTSLKEGQGERFVENKGENNLEGARRFFSYYQKEEFTALLETYNFELVKIGEAQMRGNTWLHFYSKKK